MNKAKALEKAKEWNRENPDGRQIKWVAQDGDGAWGGYADNPFRLLNGWDANEFWVYLGGRLEWKDSLTQVED